MPGSVLPASTHTDGDGVGNASWRPFAAILQLTFRELWARKITLGLFVVSTLVWSMLAFALNLDIVDGSLAAVRIFGQETRAAEAVSNPETGEVIREALSLTRLVIGVEAFVAGAAYWAVLLLGLLATASLLPDLLDSGSIGVLLAKPISRSRLLAGHVLGVVAAALVLTAYLLGMVWLVMSIKTGVWHVRYFASVIPVILVFASMYGAVVLVAVRLQSTPLALIVAYGLLLVSGVLAARDQLAPQINPPWRQVYLTLYHVLPNVGEVTSTVVQLALGDPVPSWYPLLSTMLFGLVAYAAAFVVFSRRDF